MTFSHLFPTFCVFSHAIFTMFYLDLLSMFVFFFWCFSTNTPHTTHNRQHHKTQVTHNRHHTAHNTHNTRFSPVFRRFGECESCKRNESGCSDMCTCNRPLSCECFEQEHTCQDPKAGEPCLRRRTAGEPRVSPSQAVKANDQWSRQRVVLDQFSNFKWARTSGYFL